MANGTDDHGMNVGATPGSAAPVTERPAEYDADYIVVGSGAGGGTVAARLVEAGFQVLLLEAGGDPRTSIGATPQTPGVNSLPDDYDVPAFHALSTENDGLRWDFFVRHYADEARQKRDPKYVESVEGQAEGVSTDAVIEHIVKELPEDTLAAA